MVALLELHVLGEGNRSSGSFLSSRMAERQKPGGLLDQTPRWLLGDAGRGALRPVFH